MFNYKYLYISLPSNWTKGLSNYTWKTFQTLYHRSGQSWRCWNRVLQKDELQGFVIGSR